MKSGDESSRPSMALTNLVSRNIIRSGLAHVFAPTVACIVWLAATGLATEQGTVSSYRDPTDLVRKAVQNEIEAAKDGGARFLFRGTKTTPTASPTRAGSTTEEVRSRIVTTQC